ncbi:MAG: molybdopterin molybdotransferase MoeA [Gemmatimonadota bacterium]
MSPKKRPDFELRSADWLSVADARRRILGAAHPGPTERVPALDALGRALAEDLVATATLPPWDNSAMDGYAVRGEDVWGASDTSRVHLKVVGRTRAGEQAHGPLGPGEAVRIMTGAPVPEGCDTVIRVEDTDAEGEPGRVVVRSDRDRGRNVRPRGEDMELGDRLLGQGTAVTPGVVGLLATLGRSEVVVRAQPTVAILTTGDELRGPERFDDVRAGGGVPESNGPMIAAAARRSGAVPLSLGLVRDEREALKEAIGSGTRAQALVVVGGASVGEADLVKRILGELGFREDFWRVKMRPGSPFGFGSLPVDHGPLPVFSLPGNPASAFVTFEVLVRPFLLRLGGHERVLRRRVRAVVETHLEGARDLTLFPRVTVRRQVDRLLVSSPGPQGSGLVRGLSVADGLAVIPEGIAEVREGQEVEVMLLDDSPGGEPWDGT